jgi:hypothetical protein
MMTLGLERTGEAAASQRHLPHPYLWFNIQHSGPLENLAAKGRICVIVSQDEEIGRAKAIRWICMHMTVVLLIEVLKYVRTLFVPHYSRIVTSNQPASRILALSTLARSVVSYLVKIYGATLVAPQLLTHSIQGRDVREVHMKSC